MARIELFKETAINKVQKRKYKPSKTYQSIIDDTNEKIQKHLCAEAVCIQKAKTVFAI